MTGHARLLRFLSVSALVHAVAFWSVHHPLHLPAQMERQLTVSLEPSNIASMAAGSRASFPKSPPHVARSTMPLALSRPSADNSGQKTHDQTQASPRSAPSSNPSADVMVAARVRAAIESELARYFVYPELARHYGWEGQVLMTFRVQADGHLDNIRVEKSCGYALLDRSALQALQQVGRVANAAGWLDGHAIDIRLPVLYRLEGNS